MKILFRVDGNQKVGLGHIVRCNAIANNLLERNSKTEVVFLSKFDSKSKHIVTNEHFTIIDYEVKISEEENIVKRVNKIEIDVIFIDNVYSYDPDFIIKLRKNVQVIIFHYFSPACFYADKYILPSAHTSDDIIKNELWKISDVMFLNGPEYVVINQEIKEIRRIRNNRKTNSQEIKIVITTGGSDPKGVLLKILEWLEGLILDKVDICILKGQAFIFNNELDLIKKRLPSNIHVVSYNRDELIDADIAVCTFGVSTYELLYLGIPVLSIAHAKPNAQGSLLLNQRYNALVDLGIIDELDKTTFISNLTKLVHSSFLRKTLSKLGEQIVDGKGLDRVTDAIIV